MRIFTKKLLFCLVFSGIGIISYSQLIITQNNNALQLAQKLVGGGVVISNPVLRSTPIGIVATGFFNNIGGFIDVYDSWIQFIMSLY